MLADSTQITCIPTASPERQHVQPKQSSPRTVTRYFISLLIAIAFATALSPAPTTRRIHPMTNPSLVTYPAPQGAVLSDQYSVSVDGKPVDVYLAPVYEPTHVYSRRPFGGPYSFAYFDIAAPAEVTIRTRKPLDHVRILPESRNIRPRIEDGALSFNVSEPCQLSVEPDTKNGPLLLFANPVDLNPPKPGDPGVKYFGPGIHNPGEILLGNNETLYIAGGAIVKGGVLARGNNIRITGRGIIEGLAWPHLKGPTANPICIRNCTNVRVDGIILKDSWGWNLVIEGSTKVRIDNVKICSARCENNDGIGTVNSQHVRIQDCFIRSDDDSITAKGNGWPSLDPASDGMAVDYLYVTRCVLWTDRAHIWRLGCESWAESMRNLSFRDIDVLHYDGPWLAIIQPAEDMLMENVEFRNIRVNGEGHPQLIEVFPAPTRWFRRKNTPGMVRNVLFKDLVVTGDRRGPLGLIRVSGCDADHTVEGVTFDNVIRYGHRVTQDSPEVQVNEFTSNIVFR